MLKFLNEILFEFDDIATIRYVLSALCALSTGDNEQLQLLLDMHCVDQLLKLSKEKDNKIILSVLRIIGHLFTADNSQIEGLLDEDILDGIVPHLYHSKQEVRREAAWTLSNIMAGNEHQIQKVFDYQQGRIIDVLFHKIEEDDFVVSLT